MHIQRDDLLEGGTKRRALRLMLDRLPHDHFVYAGTTMGHGALALAHACADVSKHAEIFVSGGANDPMIQKLYAAGAEVHLQNPLPVASLYELAKSYQDKGLVLPPGFDMPEFEAALVEVFENFDMPAASEIWTTAVTGTLTRAMQKAFPGKPFKTVKVVKQECDLGQAEIFIAPEKYHQPAKTPPPYPSCAYTDAKLWQFATKHAKPDALIWNTAG